MIPKLYDGRNKTFFFTNFDYTRLRSGVLPGFGNTTPIDAFKNGDFSALLTGNQIGTDALGRPIFSGPDFQSGVDALSSTACRCAIPYPGNVIPANDPLRSQVAAQIAVADGGARPGRDVVQRRGQPGRRPDVGAERAQHPGPCRPQLHAELPGQPQLLLESAAASIRNCGGVGGCTTEFSGETEPEKNNTYIGEGFYQRISTHHAHQQFDWIIRNNLVNHSTVAWDRWFMGGNSLSAGVGWPQQLWGANQGGLLDNNAGPPVFTFGGNIPYSAVGQNWQNFGFEKNDRWQFSNDLTWVKGRHTAKFGFEYRHHTFPYRGWATSHRRALRLQSRDDRPASTRRATTSRRPAIPLRRSCSVRCSRPIRRFLSIRRSTRRTRRCGSTTSSRSTTT